MAEAWRTLWESLPKDMRDRIDELAFEREITVEEMTEQVLRRGLSLMTTSRQRVQ